MNRFWSMEGPRLLWMGVAVLWIGLVTGHWVAAVFLPMAVYITWMLYQLFSLFRWFESGLKPALAPDGEGIWIGIVQYVYRRKAVDEKRKKRVKEMLSRFHSTVSALPDATIVLNKQMEIEWANAPALGLLGVDKQRDIGRRVTNLIRDPVFQKFLSRKNSKIEKEVVSPINPQITLVLQLVKFGKGKSLLLARDVSDRVEAQRSRRAFVDNASHELKSPLTVVMGYLELVAAGEDLPDEYKEPVERASEQANQMSHIIKDMLALSEVEGASLLQDDYAMEIDVASIIDKVVTDFMGSGRGQEHTFEVDTDTSLKLAGTLSAVESIVGNLISNAVKYTPEGSIIKVVWEKTKQGELCLTVSDNGDGVNIEHLPHLTERFYRVDASHNRSSGSTGLGLAIVKHTVESLGGEFEITIAEEGGLKCLSCF